MPDAMVTPVPALDRLVEQPRVRAFLSAAVAEGRVSHAYLFAGVPGSGKTEAALALAQCVICPDHGDGSCDECIRVAHRTHPDVHWLAPAGVSGYLAAQVRDLIDDVQLAPSRAKSKVYVLDRVDLLRGTAANALLKTLEEPPAGVVFILLCRSVAAVMETIVSRCQVVPFRVVDEGAAVRMVRTARGVSDDEARVALAVAGTPTRAIEWLASARRRNVRTSALTVLGELARDDSWDVLQASSSLHRSVLEAAGLLRDGKAVKRDALVKDEVAKMTEGAEDYYSAQALRRLEDDAKRVITARERSGMMELVAAVESVLRDVLLSCEGQQGRIVNADAADLVSRLSQGTGTQGALGAIDAVRRAADDLAHNVSSQLTIEVMLLGIKEALACPPSSR